MSNNEITLSTIYNFMVDRFEQIETRLDQMDKRFEQIETRFDQMDKRFEQIETRLDQMDSRFEQIDKRLDSIDARITRLAADNEEAHNNFSERITLCTNAILRLEQTFNDKISILFDAEQANRERNATLSLQTTQLFENQEKLKIRVSALEQKVV